MVSVLSRCFVLKGQKTANPQGEDEVNLRRGPLAGYGADK